MADPQTTLHYTSGANLVGNQYVPGEFGFNIADINDVAEADTLPNGARGLIWLGDTHNGADATFQAAVNAAANDPKVYGFYLADEPDPTGKNGTQISAATLKAESDYIHAHVQGAQTFMVMENMGADETPTYANTYTPANTDIDLFGLDPYPVRPQFSGGIDLNIIPAAVSAAETAGIPLKQIVPVYQSFGGGDYPYSTWTMPTSAQEQQILATWGSVVPNPVFDDVYSWGVQSNDTALSQTPAQQAIFAAHNAAVPVGTPPPAPTPTPSPEPTPMPTAGYAHTVVVMMENHDYNQIIGSSAAPYINGLAGQGELLTNYSDSGSHPSEPNYDAIYAGSTFGITDDNQHSEPDPTLATNLQAAGKTFTGYVESPGDTNHNPWESFPEGTSVEKPITAFPTPANFSSLPTVSFVIPNLNDDMHDGTVQQGDTWLKANIDSYAQWAKSNNSLLAVVWDEGSSSDHVPAILVGSGITPGSTSATAYNHYNMLSTVAAGAGVNAPNNGATAAPIVVSTTPVPTPTPPPSNDTLVLKLSEDAWKGDAKFVVSVDGKQIDSTQTVTALHSKGQLETFTYHGTWGPSPHDIGVTFLNDAWGGTPSTDRNLYVGSVSYDGVTPANHTAALFSYWTVHFHV